MYQVGFGLCSESLDGATQGRGGLAVTLLWALMVGSPLANVTPGPMIAFIALAYLEGDVLWLAISMALGETSLALDGLVVWEIVSGLVR